MPQPQALTELCSNFIYITVLQHWCGEKVYMLQELELVFQSYYVFKILANIYAGHIDPGRSGVCSIRCPRQVHGCCV